MKKSKYGLLLVSLLVVTAQAQTVNKSSIKTSTGVEGGWHGILPLHTSKKIVEERLGPAKIDDNGYYMYSTDEADIEVNYSTAPCKENRYGRGKYSVPENTVLNYRVIFKSPVSLSDLKYDPHRFDRVPSGHTLNYAAYVNVDDSISIRVHIVQDSYEEVYEIAYTESKSDIQKFDCEP